MGNLFGLDGKPLEGELPADNTPEVVLAELLEKIRSGELKPIRIMVLVDHEPADGYRSFSKSSRMTYSDAVTMTALAHRREMDQMLGL